MTEEDEAFNDIERMSKVKQTLVKAQLDKPVRTWVGLTDEEAQWLYDNSRTPSNLIDMVEAKLKEKNT